MKTNQDYKNEALSRLRGNWAPVVVAAIVYVVVCIIFLAVGDWNTISKKVPALAAFVPSTFGIKAILEGCGWIVSLFIVIPLEFGFCNSMRVLYEEADYNATSNMFRFATDNYLHIVWTGFLMTLKVLLWSLLLIIPGIIKAYAYALTPYIVVEHPEMSASEVLSESERLMEGHKFDFFWLQLSFIGWFILSLLTLGIGFFWLEPYCQTSIASFYNDIKAADAVSEIEGQ